MKKNLSIGDALVILILVLFIFGYLGGWAWIIDSSDEASTEDLEGFTALLLFAAIVFPPVWAGGLITRIVTGEDD